MLDGVATGLLVSVAALALAVLALAVAVVALAGLRRARRDARVESERVALLRSEIHALRGLRPSHHTPPTQLSLTLSARQSVSSHESQSLPEWTPPNDGSAESSPPALRDVSVRHVAEEGTPVVLGTPSLEARDDGARVSLEERIGVTWFTRIGAGVLVLGTAYAFKYVVDNRWIGPAGRVAAGAVFGALVLALAERLRSTAQRGYVHALLGVGLGVLYVTAYAAYALYGLASAPTAFVALALVSLAGGLFSVRHRSEPTLLIALCAALASPLLLSPARDRPVAFLGYLLLVTSGAMLVAQRLRFVAVVWTALAGVSVLSALWRAGVLEPTSFASAWPNVGDGPPWIALTFAVAFTAEWCWIAWSAAEHAWPAVNPTAVLLAALGFAHVASAALLWDRPVAAAVAAIALGVASAVLVPRVARTQVLAWILATSLALLLLLDPLSRPHVSLSGWIALCAVWAAAYVAAACDELLVRRGALTLGSLALLSGGPVGFFALVVRATEGTQATTRALASVGAALVLAVAAAAILVRRTECRATALHLIFVPAALGATAAALGLVGAQVTLAWAALAALAAWTSSRFESASPRVVALALFALVLLRLIGLDLWEPSRQAVLFRETLGVEGSLRPPIAGVREATLLGATVALLFSARAFGTARARSVHRPMMTALLVAAHALILLVVLFVVRELVTSYPPFNSRGSGAQFALARYEMELLAQDGRRAVAVTLAVAGYGAAVLCAGFLARSVLHRWIGLGALIVTLVKLGLWDIWMLPRPYRVLVLVSVGALLLGAGFLYARFGKRLVGMFKPADARDDIGPSTTIVTEAS